MSEEKGAAILDGCLTRINKRQALTLLLMRFHQRAAQALTAMLFMAVQASAQDAVRSVPLMTVKQIREKNQANVPVMVRGTVTGSDLIRFYLQDQTGAIGIIRTGVLLPIVPGDVLEVKGTTTGQGSGLGLNGLSAIKVGSGELPKPEVITAERLDNEARHVRVRVSGTVHEVGISSGMHLLQVQSGNTSFVAMWLGHTPENETRVLTSRLDLMDADVEIEGAAVPQYSQAGYRNGFRLVMSSAEAPHLKILRPGSPAPFKRPLRTLNSLRGLKEHHNQRCLVKGMVTYWSDAGWFHLQDESGTGRANNAHFMPETIGWLFRPGRSEPTLRPGDEIELVGLPITNRTGLASISRCEWRVTGHRDPPPFTPVSATDILQSDYDGRPVSVTGRVVDIELTTDNQGFAVHTLWMESDEVEFTALVQKRRRGSVPVKAGDYARVTGVSTTAPGVIGRAAFRVNINDFTDIHLVPPPPAWRNKNVIRWLIAGVAAIGFALIWILLLRRQVAAQTAQLRANATQLQAQLDQEKELSEMKSRFVFTVSHEFRNPLAAIMSCSDVLQRTRDQLTHEEHEHQIGGIQQSVRRMADMMEEVLLLGRAEAGRLPCEPQPLELHVFCLKLADQIRSASDARCPIELHIQPDLPRLMLDPSLLQHILGNLISNAVKYSPPDMSVDVLARHEAGAAIFTIRDRGLGIPTMDRPRIFEPFHRGSNVGETAGTGLGLAISERCARAHGGTITCESDADEGTTFIVRIPCSAESPPPSS